MAREPDPDEPHHGTAPSQGARDETRTDAGGFDTQPPPAPRERMHPNPGHHDYAAPEREGWREFDAGADWQGDAPYPAGDTGAEPETEIDAEGAAPDDLLIAATEALEAIDGLDTSGITVEQRGDTIYLRGSAATEADARRAEEALLRLSGVGRVENLLDAGQAI